MTIVTRADRLTVAVAQPSTVSCDVAENVRQHAAAVRAAGARVVVFPELSLTGYELDTAPLVHPGDQVLLPLTRACSETGSVALVGAPATDHAGQTHICMLAVTGSATVVAYRKVCLGTAETNRFQPGPGPGVYEIDGWRLGLAVCKDTSIERHIAATVALGIDVFIAGLVMHADEADEQDDRAARIARNHRLPIAFASFAGGTGSGYDATAGRSGIWGPDGSIIAQTGSAAGDIARATLVSPERRSPVT